MDWLKDIDVSLFRLIHQQWRTPLLDQFMPWLAWNSLFVPALFILATALIWKGGRRGRVFVAVLVLVLAIGEGWVINTVKHLADRNRPFAALDDIHPLVGKGRSGSMPSAHASIWFAATAVAFVYYRNSWRYLLPLASLIAYSRVYLGVHFPSDIAAGALLGSGYAFASLWAFDRIWFRGTQRWFPEIHAILPHLTRPRQSTVRPAPPDPNNVGWLRFGYLFIAVIVLARLIYLATGRIELSEDEAYQWLWSKHLAASYFSKPPLIAYAQFIGTHLWGDNQFGIRFLAPILAACSSFLMLRFLAREMNPQAGFWGIATATVVPMLAVGSTLMTVDPLLVTFWVASLISGWQAIQPSGTTRRWLWCGLWTALAFLSKYSGLFLVPCFGVFMFLWPPARLHLKRPGPYLALAIVLISMIPVVAWNYQNGWITVHHVAGNAKLDRPWTFTLRYFFEFLASQLGLLNPLFLVAALGAMAGIFSRPVRRPLELYLFSLSAPVFFGYWLYTLHSRVLPNWIAPAVPPMILLMVVYWQERWLGGSTRQARFLRSCLTFSMVFGAVAVILLHDGGLIKRMAGRNLPRKMSPYRRVSGWSETAKVIATERAKLLTEGKDVFIIGNHYGITGLMSFYMPEGRAGLPDRPLVYSLSFDRPKNQFYFWPEYRYRDYRKGQNALFIRETDEAERPPAALVEQFESIEDLGLHNITKKGAILHQIQIFACRGLR